MGNGKQMMGAVRAMVTNGHLSYKQVIQLRDSLPDPSVPDSALLGSTTTTSTTTTTATTTTTSSSDEPSAPTEADTGSGLSDQNIIIITAVSILMLVVAGVVAVA